MSAPIYTRMVQAIANRQGIVPPFAIFLGQEEEVEIKTLLTTWDVEVGILQKNYDPVSDEETRTEFRGLKIYRVDARSFLAVL